MILSPCPPVRVHPYQRMGRWTAASIGKDGHGRYGGMQDRQGARWWENGWDGSIILLTTTEGPIPYPPFHHRILFRMAEGMQQKKGQKGPCLQSLPLAGSTPLASLAEG